MRPGLCLWGWLMWAVDVVGEQRGGRVVGGRGAASKVHASGTGWRRRLATGGAAARASCDSLFSPSCSLIFTRSEPPTMPTFTCCGWGEGQRTGRELGVSTVAPSTPPRPADSSQHLCLHSHAVSTHPTTYLAQLLHEIQRLLAGSLQQQNRGIDTHSAGCLRRCANTAPAASPGGAPSEFRPHRTEPGHAWLP
jgi:hypothetical protein